MAKLVSGKEVKMIWLIQDTGGEIIALTVQGLDEARGLLNRACKVRPTAVITPVLVSRVSEKLKWEGGDGE